ncbi:cryptococcal mannosyltransferase 1-domain-containing protein [Podospora appendiculata]|uniref:Cryptococcal mannosyltransferase 1-domain-containing protein n=1 Tax=Podospora appendiculata TaxID=314037 RepID=A0AAE0X798_9PEZI|nr:cryptococcal mannosyltransferase 1-domain-containing protein [Podospora appendiculata]
MSKRRFGSFAQVCALFLCGLPIVTRLGHLSTVISARNSHQGEAQRTSPISETELPQSQLRWDRGYHKKASQNILDDGNQEAEETVEIIRHEDSSDDRNPALAPDFFAKARTSIPPILNPHDMSLNRMACPAINDTRYSHLRPLKSEPDNRRKYLFTVSLQQCINLLPSVLGPLIEVIRYLGPQNCALSIVLRNSTDGTLEALRLLADELERLDVGYWLSSTNLDPNAGPDDDRIRKLALLRTMALEPITGQHTELNDNNIIHHKSSNIRLAPDTTIISLATVAICAKDILELIHQHAHQSADMVCAMDWWFPSPQHAHAQFSSLWSSRALDGNLFTEILLPSSQDCMKEKEEAEPDLLLLASYPASHARLQAKLPFQVFACHSSLAAYAAQPLADNRVSFRGPRDGECFQGETQLFCKDMWRAGFGRIAVVPSVNVGCPSGDSGPDGGGRVKSVKGFVGDLVGGKEDEEDRIVWQGEPPERVVCMPGFGDQTWLAWDEGQV